MKKQAQLFAGIAITIAVTLVVYIGFFKINWDKDTVSSGDTETTSGNREIFSYVPADTLFFFGGLSPTSFKEAADIMTPGNDWMQHINWSEQLDEEQRKLMPPAAVMINVLTGEYMQLLKDPVAAGARLGAGSEIDAVTYSVGFIPVLRLKISDAPAFNKFIDQVEKKAGLTATTSSIGDINLRAYSMDAPGDGTKTESNFIIGTNKQYVIFTLTTKVEDENTRNLIIGSNKPARSLDVAATLNPIKDKYNFHPSYIGFVNHEEIMKGITGDKNSEFGRMLDTVINMASQSGAVQKQEPEQGDGNVAPEADNNPLQTVRTEACRKELMIMVKTWPRTVFGYTKMDLDTKPKTIDAKMLIEGTDVEFMKAMQSIRGYIPAMLMNTSSQPVFGIGFGVNMDALSPFVAKASQDFISKEYQCEALAQVKQSLIQSNPAMALGMMSGMVSGVQGVSVTVLDFDGSMDVSQPGAMPQINKLDAIITISSANPQQLLMMAANMQPGMPPLQLPPDGTPIDLPVPLPIPALSQLKLALKGNHIVAYVGEKASQLADKLASEPMSPSGLFAINMDFGKYMSLVANAAKAGASANPGNQPTALTDKEKAMLDAMSSTKMQFVETMDIQNEGIAFDIKMQSD